MSGVGGGGREEDITIYSHDSDAEEVICMSRSSTSLRTQLSGECRTFLVVMDLFRT